MSLVATKTIADKLIEELNLLIREANYIEANSFQVKMLLREADKLMPIEPGQANIIKAAVFQLCGDVEKVEYYINNAIKLPTENKSFLYLNCSAALSNIGLYLKSQGYFAQINDPTQVEFDQIVEAGFNSLSILKMDDLFVKAAKMKLTFNDERIELISRAAAVLKNNNISDAELAKYAEVFGNFLREKKLMLKGSYPDIVVGDINNNWHPETVFVTFKVNLDHGNAALLYKEGTKRLLSKFSNIPEALHFSIEAY